MHHSPVCTLDDEEITVHDVELKSNKKNRKKINQMDSDILVDRYHLTQKIRRDNFDTRQYSSDEEDQPQSPYSPDHLRQEEEDDDEEDF